MRFSLGLLFSRGEISFCHSSEVRSWHCFGASPVFLCLSWAVGTRAGHTLITTLWVQPFSWFLSHLADHPPSLYLASLSHRCSLSNLLFQDDFNLFIETSVIGTAMWYLSPVFWSEKVNSSIYFLGHDPLSLCRDVSRVLFFLCLFLSVLKFLGHSAHNTRL